MGRKQGLSKVRENYKVKITELVSVNVIRPGMFVNWPLSKLGFYLPTETSRQRPYSS